MTTTPNPENQVLERCPFCGNKLIEVRGNEYKEDFRATCIGCLSASGRYRTKPETISAWNARAGGEGDAAIERRCVLELVERFQRDPKRSQGTKNAFEWLRRQIEEGNHAYHKFEPAPANAGRFQPDECYRCELQQAAIMHLTLLATTPPAATAGDALGACVKCGHTARRWHGFCQERAGENVISDQVCGCECETDAPTPSSPARAAAEVDDAMAVCRLLTTLDWTVGYELTGENQTILDRAQQLALKVMGMTNPTPDDKGGR